MLAILQIIVTLSKINKILKFVGIFFVLIDPQQRDQEIKLEIHRFGDMKGLLELILKLTHKGFGLIMRFSNTDYFRCSFILCLQPLGRRMPFHFSNPLSTRMSHMRHVHGLRLKPSMSLLAFSFLVSKSKATLMSTRTQKRHNIVLYKNNCCWGKTKGSRTQVNQQGLCGKDFGLHRPDQKWIQ